MKKKCEKCGKEFEAYQEGFRFCPSCFSPKKKSTLPPQLLLQTYYNSKGNPLREIYIGTPEELAKIFERDGLGTKQLRDFHQRILKAWNTATLKGIEAARPYLYECAAHSEYQLQREKIPETFAQFIKHHLALAEKDEKSLDGFYHHLDSLVCYFPRKK